MVGEELAGIGVKFIVLSGWIFSLILHEWAHAYVAFRGGINLASFMEEEE